MVKMEARGNKVIMRKVKIREIIRFGIRNYLQITRKAKKAQKERKKRA